jgi:transposase
MKKAAKYGDKRMTVREVAQVLGVSARVVQLTTKRLFPEIIRNGVPTYLNETQVTAIKLKLESHHNLEGTFEAYTRLEKQLYIAKALQLAYEEIQDLEAENLRVKSELSKAQWLLEKRTTGLETIQRIAEAGGLVMSDRDDILDTYRRR